MKIDATKMEIDTKKKCKALLDGLKLNLSFKGCDYENERLQDFVGKKQRKLSPLLHKIRRHSGNGLIEIPNYRKIVKIIRERKRVSIGNANRNQSYIA